MAKEIKTIKVTTANEAQTIRAYQCFGWILLNNQEIYVKDSHLDSGYSVTETIHYVKLTFERDPSRLNNYQQLRSLEETYHAIPGPGKKPSVLGKWGIFFAGGFTLGIGLIIMAFKFMKGISFIAVNAAIIYLIQKNQKAKLRQWEAKNQKFWEKREKVLVQADRYL